jgi:hypothetical protein
VDRFWAITAIAAEPARLAGVIGDAHRRKDGGMSVPSHRVSDRVDQASNMALERSAGSPSLAAAAHRRHYPYTARRGMSRAKMG